MCSDHPDSSSIIQRTVRGALSKEQLNSKNTGEKDSRFLELLKQAHTTLTNSSTTYFKNISEDP